MSPEFSICQNNTCSITITGMSSDYDLYLKDSSIVQPYNKFKYTDTATINIIELNKVEESKILNSYIVDHCSKLDELHYNFTQDGYYTIYHIILPTKECINRIISNDIGFLEYYETIYAIDNDNILKIQDNTWVESSYEELLRNPCNTTISISSKDTFSICQLWDCYVENCKDILSNSLSKCSTESDDSKFNRDIIWMTINVIKYYLDRGEYEEAERVLEEIIGCNGFCSNSNSNSKSKKGGCGCGK